MTKGKPKTRSLRHPEDWYVEPRFCVEALADLIGPGLNGSLWRGRKSGVWDPSCGGGNILSVFRDRGFKVMGTDIVDRLSLDFHGCHDFLGLDAAFLPPGSWSIVTNPPYRDAEKFARHALRLAKRFVAILVPLNWLASRTRHVFFTEHPPLYVAYLSQRPSMPPGDVVADLGSRAFKGGKTDYCWVVWDVLQPNPMTRSVWLAPRETA
jgi:hypothetical protein